MRILVACEFSGVVRDAFIARGHEAWSCDLLPPELPGPHIQGDVLDVLDDHWDVMIAHPPCTHLCVSGARWFAGKSMQRGMFIDGNPQDLALQFVQQLMDAPIAHIAIENPISIISSRIRKPDQIIHPWQFGHAETKTTCLWLKCLPQLVSTAVVTPRKNVVRDKAPGPGRWRERSRTYSGIAAAMADQWGRYLDSLPPVVPCEIQSEIASSTGGRLAVSR